MGVTERCWVVVLAAGEDPRASGAGVSPRWRAGEGAPSPVSAALARALRLAPAERVLAVVDRQDAARWRTTLAALPPENLIVLPRDRGTAVAVLLPFLHVMRRSPNDVVVVLSADDAVRDEGAFLAATRRAITAAASAADNRVVLLGLAADDAANGVRVVPAPGDGLAVSARPVEAVVEVAADGGRAGTLAAGDLRAGVTLVSRVSGILRLYERSAPWLLRALLPSLAQRWWWRPWTLAELFDLVPSHAFARDVLRRAPDLLRVVSVPANAGAWAETARARSGDSRDLPMAG